MPDMSEATITFPFLGEKFTLDFKSYFTLFGWKFHWYGIIIALGFLLASIYAFKRSKQFGLSDDNIVDLLLYAVPIGVIGARLYYIIFYDWSFQGSLWENILRIVNIREGGLAIYGGIIFAFIGALIFSKVKKVKLGAVADIAGLGLLIGQAVGRWGNFVNREAFGYKTGVPWKMGLTNQYGTFYYHPTFLYESLWNVLGFILLHFYSKKRKFDGEVFIMYLGWYGLGRLYIEGLRQDSLFLFGTQLRVSQLVAIICVIGALALLLYNRIGKTHEPEELFVNRDLAPQEDASETLIAQEEEDEELSDIYKTLANSADAAEKEEPREESDGEHIPQEGENMPPDTGTK